MLPSSAAMANFNPRPHAGATLESVLLADLVQISIHAPMRGLRGCRSQKGGDNHFNPRPHAGATKDPDVKVTPTGFQSTPPCGGDRRGQSRSTAAGISIHAPMRGRPIGKMPIYLMDQFQSTPPCGGDCQQIAIRPLCLNFNPRPHAGVTQQEQLRQQRRSISIHAPMRGRPQCPC